LIEIRQLPYWTIALVVTMNLIFDVYSDCIEIKS